MKPIWILLVRSHRRSGAAVVQAHSGHEPQRGSHDHNVAGVFVLHDRAFARTAGRACTIGVGDPHKTITRGDGVSTQPPPPGQPCHRMRQSGQSRRQAFLAAPRFGAPTALHRARAKRRKLQYGPISKFQRRASGCVGRCGATSWTLLALTAPKITSQSAK
jgi:phage tail tape-measure protein